MARLRLGEPIDLHYSNRYFHFQRSHAIRDVFDALVELITNCDDSYHRLHKRDRRREDGGPVSVDILEKRRGPGSLVIVRDHAEGMTLHKMKEKLGDVGTRRSEAGDRGFMARGAKDCTELGTMTVESIKDDRYYKCQLTQKPQFVPLVDGNTADVRLRRELEIRRGNGTVVTLEIDPGHTMPRVSTVASTLARHHALRDILSEHSATRCVVRNLNNRSQEERVVYCQPEGVLVCDEEYPVRGYDGISAKLRLWRVDEPFDDGGERRFRRSGLVVKGARAIHECSFLYPGLEKDPLALRYFGRIECPYIDTLLNEYDARRENDETHPANNPVLLIDPNRRDGLKREHPFTKALFACPAERLKALIDEDRDRDESERKTITSKETQRKLKALAKAASRFLSQQMDELDELSMGEDVDEDFFAQKGVLIYPTYFRVALGQVRSLTFYVNRGIFDREGQEIDATCDDSSAISLLGTPFLLKAHPRKKDRLIGSFRVRGETLKDGVCITAGCEGVPAAEAVCEVVETTAQDREFAAPFEFEYRAYRVKEGSSRTLRLFAKCPELVNVETAVQALSSDETSLPILGRCVLSPVKGANYATGEVRVRGRRLIRRPISVTAALSECKACTSVSVIQKEEHGIPIQITLKNEDFGAYRAIWNVRAGRPNELLISLRHDSVRRYLRYDADTESLHGDDTPYYRVLLAEIVSEAVCRKSLELEAMERPWEFRWADIGKPNAIADAVSTELQKRIRSFAGTAHKIMVGEVRF